MRMLRVLARVCDFVGSISDWFENFRFHRLTRWSYWVYTTLDNLHWELTRKPPLVTDKEIQRELMRREMGNRLKWDKHNKLEVARDFSQGRRTYLYSEVEEPTEMWTDSEVEEPTEMWTDSEVEEPTEMWTDLIDTKVKERLDKVCQEVEDEFDARQATKGD